MCNKIKDIVWRLTRLNRAPSLHEYSLYCLHLKLNDTDAELQWKQMEKGLKGETAQKENIYGLEIPIAICPPFNAF